MQYRAVLFDFDGTLADSFDAIAASTNHVRERHGLPALSVERVKQHVGRGLEVLLQELVPHGDLAANVAAYRAHHPCVMLHLTTLLPGVRATLDTLHARGCRLGLCSNKPALFTRKILQHLGLEANFGAILGPDLVPLPKPAPDMLQAALEALQTTRKDTLYVGDMQVDIDTARAAGVSAWMVATGSQSEAELRAAGAERVFANMTELLAELLP